MRHQARKARDTRRLTHRIACGTLGIPTERVTGRAIGHRHPPPGEKARWARVRSRSAGAPCLRASELVREKARRLAAYSSRWSIDDIVSFGDRQIGVAGAPDSALGWDELARAAADPTRLPEDMEPGLDAENDFEVDDSTYPFGARVWDVEVDLGHGRRAAAPPRGRRRLRSDPQPA